MEIPCGVCHKPKAPYTCGLCATALCKNCTHFMDEGSFSFFTRIPAELPHNTYCDACYASAVEPQFAFYNQIMERAKEIQIFFKNQGKETRLVKRLEEPYRILDCQDENETILRMAFLAAKENFNAVIDVEVTAKKIKTGSRQTLEWSGTGRPAHVHDKILNR